MNETNAIWKQTCMHQADKRTAKQWSVVRQTFRSRRGNPKGINQEAIQPVQRMAACKSTAVTIYLLAMASIRSWQKRYFCYGRGILGQAHTNVTTTYMSLQPFAVLPSYEQVTLVTSSMVSNSKVIVCDSQCRLREWLQLFIGCTLRLWHVSKIQYAA